MANPRLKLALSAVTAALAFSLAVTTPPRIAGAQELVVKYDQSQLVRMERPVAEVIIGNPTVAEVTVHNPKLLVVTGKTFGITNIIMLDAERNVISEQRIVVVRDNSKVVSLHKGLKRESYNCTPQCNPAIMIGDDPAYFDQVTRVSKSKMQYSETGTHDSGGGGTGGATQ